VTSEKGWIEELLDNCTFHDTGKNWSDRDRSEVSMLRGSDGGLLPLLWYGGGSKGQIKKSGYWLIEQWGSQPEEPGRELIKTCSCGVKAVKYLEDSPFRYVFRLT